LSMQVYFLNFKWSMQADKAPRTSPKNKLYHN
jgi:hypothetical protein